MKTRIMASENGQGKVEYAILITMVALIAIGALALLGPKIGEILKSFIDSLATSSEVSAGVSTQEIPATSPEPGQTETPNPILGLIDDFKARMQKYYEENGHWPPSGGDKKFTDIGLNPDDWSDAVEGIFWNPHGDEIGLANQKGDDLQVYVNDLQGNTLHLYDNWNIWCPVNSSTCYYHTVAPGNEIDISTLVVKNEPSSGKGHKND